MENKVDVELWLKSILQKDNLAKLSINSIENAEKGGNYIGDVLYVSATGTTNSNDQKNYNLVLKCSKKSAILREQTPIQAVYLNEIFIYKTVLPSFAKFQQKANIDDVFDNVPKCFGTFVDDAEIIGLENLKEQNYYLWEKSKPMPRKYISLVVKTYGKLHATSAAIADQEPENFEKLCESSRVTMRRFAKGGKKNLTMFSAGIEQVYNLLKNDLDEATLLKWRELKNQVEALFSEQAQDFPDFQVIGHGDCWNNNFMFHSETNNIDDPSRVVVLDWQFARLNFPVIDLAYFLFTCLSAEHFENIDDILKEYYSSFAKHLRNLGSDPDLIYPEDTLFADWAKYCKLGGVFCPSTLKICLSEQNEAPDIVKSLESGKHFAEMFSFDIKDMESFKLRITPVINYLAKNNFI